MWTYYKQTYPNGVVLLFREDERRHQEVFHRQEGWKTSDELFLRRAKGDIDSEDVIREQEAESLIRSLTSPPRE